MNDREKRVKEQREYQANQRNLTGMDGKVGTVLRNLGSPIWRSGSNWLGGNEFNSPYDMGGDIDSVPSVDEMGFSDRGPDQIDTAEEGETSEVVGEHFDGLRWGMHLEIKYIDDTQELLLTYGGYPVFCEVSGELVCYVPGEWEAKIDTLFGHAKKIENERHRAVSVENKAENKRQSRNLLDHLRKYWGV